MDKGGWQIESPTQCGQWLYLLQKAMKLENEETKNMKYKINMIETIPGI